MAKICFICEGSYPYVVGGVSSWIQALLLANKEHQFYIVCIIPDEKFAQIKYEVPDNVIEIRNIVLNKKYRISPLKILSNKDRIGKEMIDQIKRAMDFHNEDSKKTFQLLEELSKEKYGNPMEITMSLPFWKAMISYYMENHRNIGFNIFYWTYRNIFLNLLSLAKEDMPIADIYHPVSTGYAGYLGAFAGSRNSGKIVLTEHGIYPREREEEVLGATWIEKSFKSIWIDFFYALSKITYDYSDQIVTLFERNREIQIEGGAPREKTLVVPNGVDTLYYESVKKEKKDGFNIGSVLRIVPIKDVKTMLRGYKLALSRMRGAHLYLIGPIEENSKYYKECLQLVKDLQMEDYVTFTGRKDVKEYYKFLDLLLLTSISEGQPLSLLEGLASGVPFISTDVGDCREILLGKKEIGDAGVIVPPTDYRELGETMVNLYQDREKLRKMGERGKEIVKKYYEKNYYVEEYKKIYQNLGGEKKWQE